MVYDIIPDRWFCIGECTRNIAVENPDGTHRPGKTTERFLTFKLPWRWRVWSINQDAVVVGFPRFVLRFRTGWVVDQ